jgi:transposase, IS5 family
MFFLGYKNHVNAGAKHKLIRRYEVTDAAVHDSQKLDELLTKGNKSVDVCRRQRLSLERDRGATARRRLQEPYSSAGHSQSFAVGSASEGEPQQKQNSRPRRARVRSSADCAGRPDRAPIGIVRARAKIGLQNLAYNIRRLVTLEQITTA